MLYLRPSNIDNTGMSTRCLCLMEDSDAEESGAIEEKRSGFGRICAHYSANSYHSDHNPQCHRDEGKWYLLPDWVRFRPLGRFPNDGPVEGLNLWGLIIQAVRTHGAL